MGHCVVLSSSGVRPASSLFLVFFNYLGKYILINNGWTKKICG